MEEVTKQDRRLAICSRWELVLAYFCTRYSSHVACTSQCSGENSQKPKLMFKEPKLAPYSSALVP